MSIKKSLCIVSATLLAGFLFACTAGKAMEETQGLNSTQTPGATQSPGSTQTPPPSSTPAPTKNPADDFADPSAAFGRFVASIEDKHFYILADSIVVRQGNGEEAKERKLFDLPKTGIVEDLFATEQSLYFTMTLDDASKTAAVDRTLYRAANVNGLYTIEPVLSIKGPALASGQTIYFIKDERLSSFNCADGTEKEVVKVNANTELFNWGYFDGKALYYSIYDEKEPDGTLYGPSKLYRLDLADGNTTLMGDRNRPFADSYLFGQDGVLYRLTSNSKGFEVTILDSYKGPMESAYTVPEDILKDTLGAEKLYVGEDALYILIGRSVSPADGGSTAALFKLTAYRLLPGDASAEELWTNEFLQNAAGYDIDRSSETISLLTEGNESSDALLYRLNLLDGKIAEKTVAKSIDFMSSKKLIAAGGAVWVYSLFGEDAPRPSLAYAQFK